MDTFFLSSERFYKSLIFFSHDTPNWICQIFQSLLFFLISTWHNTVSWFTIMLPLQYLFIYFFFWSKIFSHIFSFIFSYHAVRFYFTRMESLTKGRENNVYGWFLLFLRFSLKICLISIPKVLQKKSMIIPLSVKIFMLIIYSDINT